MRELIVFLLFLSGVSALAGTYFSFMASTSMQEAKRKSYVAIKSQANAMTFIFLSGLILSQSLILASNFTAPDIPDSAISGTPTGLVVSETPDIPGESAPTIPPETSGDIGAAAPKAPALDSGETPDEIPPDAPPAEETGTTPVPETDSGNIDISGDNASISEPPVIISENRTESPPPPVLPEPAQNESAEPGISESAQNVTQNSTAPENGSEELVSSAPNVSENLPPVTEIDVNITEPSAPVLEMRLNVSENIRRGDAFSLFVEIANTGASGAKNVAVDFTMPEGVSFVSGEKSIGEIPAGETIRREFIFKSGYGANLGAGKIKVRMTYE